MGTGRGRGKSIFFGEHFVVYGLPALAAGIDSETMAKITRKDTPGWSLDDDRPATPGYKEKKLDEQKVSINNIIDHVGLDVSEQGIHIELAGNLICASGIGASAASCVAIARALNDEFDLGLNDEQINETAYEGEKGYHGTPSGIDNTASTYGGLVWYERDLDGGSPTFKRIELDKSVSLVIASTGLTASTTEVVGDVRRKKEKNPEWFDNIADEYKSLVQDGLKALKQHDLKRVGKLMSRNHELLQELTVSCKELDDFVDTALTNGALGAKLTGTGRGGNMISLPPDEAAGDKIAAALEGRGAATVLRTTFG